VIPRRVNVVHTEVFPFVRKLVVLSSVARLQYSKLRFSESGKWISHQHSAWKNIRKLLFSAEQNGNTEEIDFTPSV